MFFLRPTVHSFDGSMKNNAWGSKLLKVTPPPIGKDQDQDQDQEQNIDGELDQDQSGEKIYDINGEDTENRFILFIAHTKKKKKKKKKNS